MRHCTPDELMDVVDDVRDEASLPHLAACALCREQLREVRQMLLQVADAPVPEPSPLFWVTSPRACMTPWRPRPGSRRVAGGPRGGWRCLSPASSRRWPSPCP